MAVESPHLNLLSPQLIINNNNNTNSDIMTKPSYHILNHEIDGVMPMPHSTMSDSNFFPFYQQSNFCHQIPTSFNKSDSGLTYHHVSRKRSRDSITDSNALPISQKNKLSSLNHQPSLFQNQNFLLLHLHNQRFEIDRFIAQHTEKMRMELEEQSVRESRKLLSVIHEAVEKKVKEKDEEIERMVNLNWVLQEKVKSLCDENQIWRDLAQTNEATVISLRTNLEQVLAAQISEDHRDDDTESSCGSNCMEACGGDAVVGRMCKNCGVRDSIVLLLPCRHLCLCTVCGSTTRNCPLCHSGINASVHVNFDY
ncbi:hypothetical protein Lal_00016228 [Lupinus albus]|uniref:Putative transcription factor C2H2 family n=1 Tax=Lupinus albus TaxID=3870 RepID=A0A6A5MDU3_LUPAL|nr:putative transcription factor C2H2 family [Lupinus albus]KAF1873101.1 hypothetical protein Lal_00016228 [Lupinus albus]